MPQTNCFLFVILFLVSSFASLKAEVPTTPLERWGPSIEKFEEADQMEPVKPGQVLFIGSSSIRLWDLKQSFPELDALNRGFGGSQLEDSIAFFDRIVKPYQPRQIILYAGDNDLGKGKTPVQVYQDFQTFAALVKEHLPNTTLVFIAIKPSLKRWNIVHRVRAANALINVDCVEDETLTFLDIDTPMIAEDGLPKQDLFKTDGLHLNEKGYEIWTEVLRTHLKERTEIKETEPTP